MKLLLPLKVFLKMDKKRNTPIKNIKDIIRKPMEKMKRINKHRIFIV